MSLARSIEPSDETLALLAAGGDAAALDRLIERCYRDMYRAAFRWCRHRENAEDIAHEACIKLGRHIGSYRGEAKFRTWLYRLVLNAAKDFTRKHRQMDRTESAYLREGVETVSGGQEERQSANRVAALLDALPDPLRETAWLVFAEEFTHKEAADLLGCAEATISWRIVKLRKILAPQLKGALA